MITVGELTLRSEQVVSVNFQYVPVFLAAGVMYLIATTAIVVLQSRLEAHLNIERRARIIAQTALRAREAGMLAPAVATEGVGAPAVEPPGNGRRLLRGGLRFRLRRRSESTPLPALPVQSSGSAAALSASVCLAGGIWSQR